MWLIGSFQVLVVVLLIAVTALVRQPSRGRWASAVLAFGLVLAFMWVSSRWDMVSIYLRWIYPILFLLAALIGFGRIQAPDPPLSRLQSVVGLGVNLLLIVAMAGLLGRTLMGYSKPEGAIDLRSPLRDIPSVVLHGGGSPFINAHAKVQPQNYALDIVGLDGWGRRAGFFGSNGELSRYQIFGATLYSPCSGRVAAAVDGHEDMIPPATDRKNLAGNHVLLECEGVEVLLAHLKKGSMEVQVGDVVTTESVLGQVGNSGNTSEPHLHLHAEQGGEPGVSLDGRAVPITLDGRFLVRSDTLWPR